MRIFCGKQSKHIMNLQLCISLCVFSSLISSAEPKTQFLRTSLDDLQRSIQTIRLHPSTELANAVLGIQNEAHFSPDGNFVASEAVNEGGVAMSRRHRAKSGVARSVEALNLKSAACMPEYRTVKLKHEDALISYNLSCVRLHQCGGCCVSDLLECQPTRVAPVNFTVQASRRTGANEWKFVGPQVVTLWKHEKCACACKVKATDCAPNQEFNEGECRCKCRPQSLKDTCPEGFSRHPTKCECYPPDLG